MLKRPSMDIMGPKFERKMNLLAHLVLFILVGLFVPLGGCSYTLTAVQGPKVTSAQVQEIKLGRTTEMDLFKLLGPASKKERIRNGNERLLFETTEIKSLTFPGGFQAKGFLDKEEDEIFEVILKDGIVQSYRFLNP